MSDLVQNVYRRLTGAGIVEARAEAEAIVAAAGGEDARIEALTTRRLAGAPLAHLTGRHIFLGVEMLAAPGALVPRRETELLGQAAIDLLAEHVPAASQVIDVCCGAGNLACAIALKVASARVWASDLTEGSVAVAQKNVDHLALRDRVSVHRGDLFAAFDENDLEGQIDLVVANPPYISTKRLTEGDRRSLLDHEPREAFDGGPYGLSIHQRLIKEAPRYLRPRGFLTFEFGLGQERQVAALFRRVKDYRDLQFLSDDAGNARVAVSQFAPT